MKLAVYCASGSGNDPVYGEFASRLGGWLATQGHTLVYGGGDSGLMGQVSQAAFLGGSQVIGVLPGDVDFICSRPQPWCTQVIVASDMTARKKTMLELADAFLALPGGTGTLDEISETITLTKIGVFRKPSVLLNVNGFYEPLRQMVDHMTEEGFIAPGTMDHVCFTDDLAVLQDFIEDYAAEAAHE